MVQFKSIFGFKVKSELGLIFVCRLPFGCHSLPFCCIALHCNSLLHWAQSIKALALSTKNWHAGRRSARSIAFVCLFHCVSLRRRRRLLLLPLLFWPIRTSSPPALALHLDVDNHSRSNSLNGVHVRSGGVSLTEHLRPAFASQPAAQLAQAFASTSHGSAMTS